MLRPYQKLIAWQEAHELCLWIYQCTEKFPASEKIGLISQMRRAAVSVCSNIAEGSRKKSHKEKFRFYETAICSLEELHYQCLLSKDLRYMDNVQFTEADGRISRVSFLTTKLRAAL